MLQTILAKVFCTPFHQSNVCCNSSSWFRHPFISNPSKKVGLTILFFKMRLFCYNNQIDLRWSKQAKSCFMFQHCLQHCFFFHHYEWCHVISGSSNCKLANSRAPGYPGSCLDSNFVSQWLITMWQFMWFWLQVQGWSIDWHVSSKSTQPALLNKKQLDCLNNHFAQDSLAL